MATGQGVVELMTVIITPIKGPTVKIPIDNNIETREA